MRLNPHPETEAFATVQFGVEASKISSSEAEALMNGPSVPSAQCDSRLAGERLFQRLGLPGDKTYTDRSNS